MNKRIAVVLSLVSALVVPILALAHTHLERTLPEQGKVVNAAPGNVELWFSGKVDAQWSTVTVKNAEGKRVDKGGVAAGDDDKHVKVALEPLTAGSYDVDWNVVSGDGHRMKGQFSFVVE